jgi:hypothetical protein
MAGIDMYKGKGKFPGPEGLKCQVDEGDRVFPTAEQQGRPFELAGDLTENVDRFGLELVQVI